MQASHTTSRRIKLKFSYYYNLSNANGSFTLTKGYFCSFLVSLLRVWIMTLGQILRVILSGSCGCSVHLKVRPYKYTEQFSAFLIYIWK